MSSLSPEEYLKKKSFDLNGKLYQGDDFTQVYIHDAFEAVKKARNNEREKVFNELIFDKRTDTLKINPEAVEKVSVRVRIETVKEVSSWLYSLWVSEPNQKVNYKIILEKYNKQFLADRGQSNEKVVK